VIAVLRDLIDAYMVELPNTGKSQNTVANYRLHLAKFADWCESCGVDYLQLSYKDSKAFRNMLATQKLASRTINTILAAVRSFYNYLAEEGSVTANPILTGQLRVKEEKRQPAFLTEADVAKVIEGMAGLPYHVSLAFRTMLAAGLRVSEASDLEPGDVELLRSRVFLHVQRGKGNKERHAPVTDAGVARELLTFAIERKGKGRLFGVVAGTLKVYANNLKKTTGVDFHSHRMRHTLATRQLAQGTPIDVVQVILGHADISTTRRYAETLPEALFKVAAAVG
jgi:site-specific recombinase XerD